MADDIPVNVEAKPIEEKQTKKKPTKKPLRYSNWFITINTNKAFKEKNDAYKKFVTKFYKCLKDMFTSPGIHQYVRITKEGVDYNHSVINNIDGEWRIERGKKKFMIHMHGMIKIHHRTNVHLEYLKMKAKIINDMGLEGVHFDAKLYKSADDCIDKYIRKDDADEYEVVDPDEL